MLFNYCKLGFYKAHPLCTCIHYNDNHYHRTGRHFTNPFFFLLFSITHFSTPLTCKSNHYSLQNNHSLKQATKSRWCSQYRSFIKSRIFFLFLTGFRRIYSIRLNFHDLASLVSRDDLSHESRDGGRGVWVEGM